MEWTLAHGASRVENIGCAILTMEVVPTTYLVLLLLLLLLLRIRSVMRVAARTFSILSAVITRLCLCVVSLL